MACSRYRQLRGGSCVLNFPLFKAIFRQRLIRYAECWRRQLRGIGLLAREKRERKFFPLAPSLCAKSLNMGKIRGRGARGGGPKEGGNKVPIISDRRGAPSFGPPPRNKAQLRRPPQRNKEKKRSVGADRTPLSRLAPSHLPFQWRQDVRQSPYTIYEIVPREGTPAHHTVARRRAAAHASCAVRASTAPKRRLGRCGGRGP